MIKKAKKVTLRPYRDLQKEAREKGMQGTNHATREQIEKYLMLNKKVTTLVKPQKGTTNNPSGKGGFGDNPQNRNNEGRPPKEKSFTFWLDFFKSLTVDEFLTWKQDFAKNERTVAASLAYARVFRSRDSLKEFKEVADRTEGRAPESIDLTTGGGQPIGVFNDEQIKRIADRISGVRRGNGSTPSKE